MLIEDYAFLSNLESAALVGRDGSIDWLCFPRFDSNACFAALLGDESHGRWLLAPAGGVRRATRRYRPGTLVLETDFETDDGAVRVVDCMPPDGAEHGVVRVVEGLEGRVPMRMQLAVRLDYGSVIPWVTSDHGAVLKGLTYGPTGGIVAAPTTSLPEALGGERNWDYRYCWLRDAALTLGALLRCGYIDEGLAFREWVLRSTAGHPREAQIMYGVAGERRLTEYELDWLPGYEGSRPVRVGNEAASQFQLDVFGEVMDAGHVGRLAATARGISLDTPRFRRNWRRSLALMRFLEEIWHQPDEGIWEVRGPSRPFTHSRVMAWVAFDRAVRAVEEFGLEGPVDEWKKLRDEIHAEVCRDGFDAQRGTFTQYYGSKELDASLLLLPTMGFLPADDPRILGTIEAVRRELCEDGFVYRYTTGDEGEHEVDGLRGKEGVFLPCSFWLVDALAMSGQVEDARALFERLLSLRNDVGLLAEEYDISAGRLVGNFPQAFTHLALVGSALRLDEAS